MPFARRYPGHGPFEEVWFCEVRITPDRGLWFRYTITDSADPTSPFRHTAVWAMPFWRDKALGFREKHDLSLLEANEGYALGNNVLTADGADGSAGDVSWSLKFTDRGASHNHVPKFIGMLPIKRRNYVPAIFDLRVNGHVQIGDERIEVTDGHGVLGHIWGSANTTKTWAWTHANTFESDPDAIFESLGVLLDRPILRTRPFTSMVLRTGGQTYPFTTTLGCFQARSEWGARRWSFGSKSGGMELEGEAELPAEAVRVTYTKPDGSLIYCENSRFCKLTVRLKGNGVDTELSTTDAAFEIGSREPLPNLHLEG